MLFLCVYCDNRMRFTISYCKETLGLDLAKMFSSPDDILAQEVSCSNNAMAPDTPLSATVLSQCTQCQGHIFIHRHIGLCHHLIKGSRVTALQTLVYI